MFRPLTDDQTNATGGRMDQDGVAGLHDIRLAQQHAGRHAADHHRGGDTVVDAVGQRNEPRRRHDALLGIRAFRRRRIGDALAQREAGDAGADRLDHAGALQPDRRGKRFDRVNAAALEHVAIVDRDRAVAHPHLSGPGFAGFDLLESQDLGAAGGVEAESLAHVRLCSANTFDRFSIMSARSLSALNRGCDAMYGDITTLSNFKSSSSLRPGNS